MSTSFHRPHGEMPPPVMPEQPDKNKSALKIIKKADWEQKKAEAATKQVQKPAENQKTKPTDEWTKGWEKLREDKKAQVRDAKPAAYMKFKEIFKDKEPGS